ncbi:hypothetical protein [Bartonella sp. CB60]|uniref:hypothetical protein n=1 Tax=Bartonella sp. CB60 TaxID=3113619 RepID=UPI00300E5418
MHRIICIFFVFLVFGASFFIPRIKGSYQIVLNETLPSRQVSLTEIGDTFLERLVLFFPDVIASLSKMSPQQKQQLVELIRQDAVIIASANGQSDEDAQKFGEVISVALSKAIFHPYVSDAYF